MKKGAMTRFFCQELLFDYVTGKLPTERAEEIAEFLKTDEICREDLANLKKAIVFCEKLGQIKAPRTWIERWRSLPPALAKRISNFETKLISRLWTALPYTVSVTLVLLALVIFKPWRALNEKEIVVWSAPASQTSVVVSAPVADKSAEEVAQTPVKAPSEKEAKPAAKTPEKEAKPQASVPAKAVTVAKADKPVAKESPDSVAAPVESLVSGAATVGKSESKPESTKVASAAQQISEQDIKAEEENPNPDGATATASTTHEKSKPGPLRGELYHASLEVDELDGATDQVKNKIIELGGEKARKVELGWRRKTDQSYFHFTLPESNLAPLTEFLKTLGPVLISKEKHPVVMPPGKIRIILILKENADNAEHDETSP